MKIPFILGAPLHLWLGISLFLLVVFQILVAKKLLKIPFKAHRIAGYIILIIAIFHASIAIGLRLGFMVY